MKPILAPSKVARDERFERMGFMEQQNDPRRRADEAAAGRGRRSNRMSPHTASGPDDARRLMHGIMMGELQALEGAGRTCWDFETGNEAPFALKLDMARQCWDEARHCEISVKLAEHMGTELGEYGETMGLYSAACNPDPVLRLTAVNRGIEGLAIDVFTNMRIFAAEAGDPVLGFCEDWMLADEVTHVKMGSDWLRRMTENDPERRDRALAFQRIVDKLFSGTINDDNESVQREFRRLAGFSDTDIDEALEGFDDEDEEMAARHRLSAKAYR